MPIGMHRPQPSRWKNVWPFLVILIVVPALGWAAATFLANRQNGQPLGTVTTGSPTAPAQQSGTDNPSSEPTPSEEPTPSPSPSTTTEAPPTPDYNAAIQVLNGTGTQGLAASNTQKLNAAGYAGTSAANATGWDTQVSTVYYEDPRMEATAKDVAATLGIDNVQRTDNIGSPDVVVVLR